MVVAGDHRLRERHQEVQRRHQVRHHHPGRGQGRGVQAQEDVEVAERYHQKHSRRNRFPGGHHLQEHPQVRSNTSLFKRVSNWGPEEGPITLIRC